MKIIKFILATLFLSFCFACYSDTKFQNKKTNDTTVSMKTINESDSLKIKDFFEAIAKNDLTQVNMFIKRGIDVNQKDEDGQTALMIATMNNHPKIVKILLENKADVDAYGKHAVDRNPINYASAYGLTDIVTILIEYKPNMMLLNAYGGTPLIPACEEGHYEVAKLLLEKTNVNVNHINNLGYTAIYEVVFTKGRSPIYVDIAKLLIKHGANINIPDKDGNTPLAIAKKNNLNDLVTLLEQNGGK